MLHAEAVALSTVMLCVPDLCLRCAGDPKALVMRSQRLAISAAEQLPCWFVKDELHKMLAAGARRFVVLPLELARALSAQALQVHSPNNGVMDVLECGFQNARAVDKHIEYADFAELVVAKAGVVPAVPAAALQLVNAAVAGVLDSLERQQEQEL